MDLVFSPEQEELRASLRRFLSEKSPMSAVRALMDGPVGYDPAVWRQMAQQLGLQGLALPEKYGGSGYGFVELAVVQEELGRALLPGPFTSTVVLAAHAVLDAADPAAAEELLPGIADGSTIATLAAAGADGRWDPGAPALSAEPVSAGWVLRGTVGQVPDGHLAGLVLASARTTAGPSLFAVDGSAANLTRTPRATLDQTSRLARLEFDGVAARLVGADGAAGSTLRRTLDRAAVALALEQVGGAQRALEMAVEYAKVRQQFDRPIGSFQAVGQRVADAYIQVLALRLALWNAAWKLDAGADPDVELDTDAEWDEGAVASAVAIAKFWAAEAGHHVAHTAVHVHGGAGIDVEHQVHRHFLAAKRAEFELGGATAQLRTLGTILAR